MTELNYRPVSLIAPGSIPRRVFELAKDITPQTIVIWGSDQIRCVATGFFEGSTGRRLESIDEAEGFSIFVDLETHLLIEEDTRNIFRLAELGVGDIVKKVDHNRDEVYVCVAMGSNLALTQICGKHNHSELIIIDEKNSKVRVYIVELLDPEEVSPDVEDYLDAEF
jgi:hypothetical protein